MEAEKRYWFVFYKDRLLIDLVDGFYHVPCCKEPPMEIPVGSTVQTVGMWNDLECKAYSVNTPINGTKSPGRVMESLRTTFEMLPLKEYKWAGKASQILNWDVNTKYCPHCGEPMHQISPIGKKCPVCRQEFYPIISPAVIVRITRGDEILLVHARNFKADYYGLIAGFLEPGESLEECVYREVCEETQLKIKNLEYFGSQSWPYPSGIMVGYTAEYESGELTLQNAELSKGGWFRKDNLPMIPKKLSLARKLIDDWLEEETEMLADY